MFRGSARRGARVYGLPFGEYRGVNATTTANPSNHLSAKSREGVLQPDISDDRHQRLRRALHAFTQEPEERRRVTKLLGVEFESDLPADPVTRLFFQRKGDAALYEGSYDVPVNVDDDRVVLRNRTTEHKSRHRQPSALYDFCHRVREASEQYKRFVIVPSTSETKGVAQIMLNHGLVSGFRDFHNDRAFAVELKYFQNEPSLMGIEPVHKDPAQEYLWSPKMIRRMRKPFGITNKIRIYPIRTWDGRIIDNLQAADENLGGLGLCVVW